MNAEIIRQGYGHAYTKYPFNDDMMKQFRAHEKAAREAGRGLWGSDVGIDGKDTKAPAAVEVKGEVYLTNSGTKYHTATCRFVAKSKIPASLEGAKAKGLEPCSVCNPPK